MDNSVIISQLIQYLITGMTVGSIYAMIAVGFNIIYNVTEIINLAQGEFVVLGGLVMVFIRVTLSIPTILAFPLTLLIVFMVGVLFDRLDPADQTAVGDDTDYCHNRGIHDFERLCYVYLGQGSI